MGVSEYLLPYTDALFLFIWYSVQFIFEIAVIVYVSKTLNWPARFWINPTEEVQQPASNPVATATSFVADAAQVARALKDALNTNK